MTADEMMARGFKRLRQSAAPANFSPDVVAQFAMATPVARVQRGLCEASILLVFNVAKVAACLLVLAI